MGFRVSAAEEAALEKLCIERGGKVIRAKLPGTPPPRNTGKLMPSIGTRAAYAKPQGPCQSLWIPNWMPGLLNQWDGQHWSKRAKIKKADRVIVATYFAGAEMFLADGPRRVSMLFVLPKGKRMFDRDAPFKSCLDALVHCRALVNDSPKWCVHGPVSYARAIGAESVVGTLILLEDM